MKLLVIFNPSSAKGKAMKILPLIEKLLTQKKIDYKLVKTESSGHATLIARDTDLSAYNGIVAAGGDGTVYEVVNGYMNNAGKNKPPFGIVPVGTGNAFARDLDLMPNEVEKSLNIISKENTRNIDAARVTMQNEIFYYLNILGFGFVADVNKSAQKYKKLGNVAYSLGVFEQLLFLKSFYLKMETEQGIIERENHFAEISNTQYTGTSFLMAPTAEIDDGLLDVTLLNKTTRRRIIKIFPSIFNGEHTKYPEVETFKVKRIKIETKTPKILTPDGELMGSTPIEIVCLKQVLPTFWP